MTKVLMQKTVFDGKVYHRAGQIVEIKDELAKFYYSRGFAFELKEEIIDELIEMEEEEKQEKAEIETKEQKVPKRKTK